MIALLLSLASQLAIGQGFDPATLKGRCDYPGTLSAPEPGELRVFCDSVAITAGKNPRGRLVQFDHSSSGRVFGFEGEIVGKRMTIRQIHLPQRAAAEAKGYCQVFHRGNELSAVSCVARLGGRTYVANFKPSSR